MVTTVGKLFVLLVFALSIGFLALAIGVYSNHIEWKSANKDQPGVVDKLQQKIGELASARDRAETRYMAAYGQLGIAEQERAYRKLYYQYKNAMVLTGKDDKGNVVPTPIYRVTKPASGLIPLQSLKLIGTEGEIAKSPREEPLQSLAFYKEQLAARDKDITDEKTKVEQEQKKLENLTFEMNGTPNGPPGLIRKKELQVEARTRAAAEQEFLKPDLANRFGETVIVLKREGELRKRLEQLDRGASARLDR